LGYKEAQLAVHCVRQFLKAITLMQPWAAAVANGVKQFETRSWTTSYRGLIAIHAAKGFPKWARDFAKTEQALGRMPRDLPLGAIVATARITAVFRVEELASHLSAIERLYGDYSPGRYAWQLSDVRTLAKPIQCRGALSLWAVPTDVEAALKSAHSIAEAFSRN
jgi:activating signal cointegrator 1